MATERLARFFGLTLLSRFDVRGETRRPDGAQPVAEPAAPRPRRICGSTPAPPVEPELPSLEAELARLDGRPAL